MFLSKKIELRNVTQTYWSPIPINSLFPHLTDRAYINYIILEIGSHWIQWKLIIIRVPNSVMEP